MGTPPLSCPHSFCCLPGLWVARVMLSMRIQSRASRDSHRTSSTEMVHGQTRSTTQVPKLPCEPDPWAALRTTQFFSAEEKSNTSKQLDFYFYLFILQGGKRSIMKILRILSPCMLKVFFFSLFLFLFFLFKCNPSCHLD